MPNIESDSALPKYFMKHQIDWILAENPIHQRGQQAIALAEKSIRIGWTYADGFKNVRKRILFKNRDYLFATKDLPSALNTSISATNSPRSLISPSSLLSTMTLPSKSIASMNVVNLPLSPKTFASA